MTHKDTRALLFSPDLELAQRIDRQRWIRSVLVPVGAR